MVRRVIGVLGFSVVALVVGCTADTFATGGDLPGADAGGDSGPGEDGGVATCASGMEPKDDPACVTEATGVFVSPKGDDGAAGTRAAPLRTVGAAMKALAGRSKVFLCGGSYPEDVTMDSAQSANVYGGFSCVDWSYTGERPVLGASVTALKMTGTAGAHVFEDVSFVARDAVQPGQASIAVVLHDAGEVSFVRAHIEAGRGQKGADGVTGSNYAAVAINDPSVMGNAASGTTGGVSRKCTCKDASFSVGGAGGDQGVNGHDGTPAVTVLQPGIDGAGGWFNAGNGQCGAGHDGGRGNAGMDSPATPAVVGGLDHDRNWTSANGQPGLNGTPGQGGGGSSGNYASGGPGGSCGGCGGAGGGGGQGGGASVGVLALGETTLSAKDSEIVTHAGGDGGDGATGQGGQGGAQATAGICFGGHGGGGGRGGAGTGGAGGVSVGVIYDVHAPVVSATTTTGAAGAGGQGGVAANAGADGFAKATYKVELAAP